MEGLVKKVSSHEQIKVHFHAKIEDVHGFIGNFKTKVRPMEGSPLRSSTALLSSPPVNPNGNPTCTDTAPTRVRTQLDMAAAMSTGDPAVMKADTTVFIQCVGFAVRNAPGAEGML